MAWSPATFENDDTNMLSIDGFTGNLFPSFGALAVLKTLKQFETGLIYVLLFLMAVVLAFSTLELLWRVLKDILSPPFLQITIEGLIDVFGLFMVILIGLELMESVKAYLRDNIFQIEVILIVAMIAIARKIIILDLKKMDVLEVLGIGAIILSLSVSYFLIVTSRSKRKPS